MRLIAHLSDLHFGRHDPKIAEALVESVSRARPDLTVVSGDLTQRARPSEFAAARAFLDRLSPNVVVPGNHDVPLYDVTRRFLRPLAGYRRYICAEPEPFFADEEIAVLGVNTARSAALVNGRISHAQAEALRGKFAHVPPGRFRIVVAHHPLMPPPDAPKLRVVGRSAMALEAIAKAGVHLVLAGHYHRAFSGDLATRHFAVRGSVLVVQAGTACSTRLRAEPNSFNLIRIEPRRVSCAIRILRGARFATADTVDYALVGDTWIRQ